MTFNDPVATTVPVNDRHPKGLWVLFITEMWERFSYYGMRALLVLYLIAGTGDLLATGKPNENPGFGWSKEQAYVLYGLYTWAVYLTPLAGGWLADRFLGTNRSMIIGGWIIAAGHITLALTELFGITPGKAVTLDTGPGAFVCFLTGLVLIVIGTGFFKPCVSVMVGQLYEHGDPKRDSGFTIFYMGINLGAFLSPIIAGWLGEKIGWHWGFGSAAVGMILGLVFYQYFRPKYLEGIGLPPQRAAADEETPALPRPPLSSVDWQRIGVILVLAFFGNIFFWTAFEQAGSSMNVFAKEKTDRTLGGLIGAAEPGQNGEVVASADAGFAATLYQAVNPLAIVLFAPVFAWLWLTLSRKNLNPSTPMKFAWGLYLLGLAFLAMVFGSFEAHGANLAGAHWLLITYVIVTWGELCLSPVGLSMVTKLSPPHLQSLMMGVWFFSFSLSNLLAGLVAAFSTQMDTTRHYVPVVADSVYADVRLDARAREFQVLVVGADQETPVKLDASEIPFSGTAVRDDGSTVDVSLTLRSGDDASQFTASIADLPDDVDDIEDVSGSFAIAVEGETQTAELVHDHITFVFPGLAGFFLLLVVFPVGAGVIITLLSPMLKRMMHGIE